MFSLVKKFAYKEGDNAELAFRKRLTVIIAGMCGLCGLLWSGFYYVVFGFGVIAFLPLLFIIVVGSAAILSHILKNYKLLVHTLLACILSIPVLIQWAIGGIDPSGFAGAWGFLAPLIAVIFLSPRQGIFWMALYLIVIIISAVYQPALLGYASKVSAPVKTIFYMMNIGAASIVVFIAAAWFVKTIQTEKMRSDNLLLNILPREVADELKTKGYSDARQFDNVTVLFTDFKSFTTISEKLCPQDLVNELHNCFSAFDKIILKYGIEKVKTIGDAYLAVSGLPIANDEHASNMVRAALEIRDYMLNHKKKMEDAGYISFEVRIGVHSGSVVAGIVGLKKFAYDIWGDTVNTAARMEQNGEAGKVNISEATYKLIKDKFNFEYRGEIEAKNKGKLKMYFVGEQL